MNAEKKDAPGPVPATLSKDLDVPESPEIIGGIAPRPDEERPAATDPSDPEPRRQRVTPGQQHLSITLWLIWMLSGLIFVHYCFMFYLDWHGKKLENVNNAFNATLPVIAGLAGSAITYYFTRRSEK